MQGEHSVSALARLYPMSFAAVQKHVAVLERAELVTKRRRGREQLVRGNVETVRDGRRGCSISSKSLWRSRTRPVRRGPRRDRRPTDHPDPTDHPREGVTHDRHQRRTRTPRP